MANYETMVINVRNNPNKSEVDYYKSLSYFGWIQDSKEIATKKFKGRTRTFVQYKFKRDVEQKNYQEFKQLEKEYNDLRREIRHYQPMEPVFVFLMFLLFIIPGVIYVGYKNVQKRNINMNNNTSFAKMNAILSVAKKL